MKKIIAIIILLILNHVHVFAFEYDSWKHIDDNLKTNIDNNLDKFQEEKLIKIQNKIQYLLKSKKLSIKNQNIINYIYLRISERLLEIKKNQDNIVKKWDRISVDYIGKFEDWTIFDSSIEEFAKKSPDFIASSWREYEPLEFTAWVGQMIKWFDEWVIWMKIGEKKTLIIKPVDWYWEVAILQNIPKKYLEDYFEQNVPETSFRDYVTQTVPKEALWEKSKDLKVGEKLDYEWMTWEVEAITNSWITIKIENKDNPFFGKEIVVWAKADYQWNTITIKKIDKDMITVNILNKQSPFYSKKLAVWLIWKLVSWDEVKIEKIWEENITISTKNQHKLAWKTLIFEIEIKEIK